MFSPNAYENGKLIDICFIAGVNQDNIISILNTDMNKSPKFDILLSIPDDKGTITQGILDFVFPDGLNFSYSEELAKFYAVVLTNEKGIRSYVYVLKFSEKICTEDFIIIENKKDSLKNFNLSPKLSLSNYTFEGKFYYIPIAICFWSHTSNTEFFKNLLHEIYKLITYKESFYSISNEQMKDYLNIELMNYFIFLHNLIKPCSYTKMTLNLRFSNLEIYFPSKYELAKNDMNIEILFNSLEITVIIKLWISILNEKHIIILANQNFILFAICEALMSLIFPFRWLHTYIPILSYNELDYLESPTPYIMGVHSNYTDYQYLKELFPNHVICDVNTSQLFSNPICSLPSLDENKLRKKLLYIKNPELYSIEEILLNQNKNLLMEDVSPNRTFSENVQYIFFRIFRTHLGNLNNYKNENKVFDSQKFMDDFIDEEYREFWGKIINTVAFEYFILSDQFLDDSNIKIFKNIISNKDEEKYENKIDMFHLSINLPNNINDLFDDVLNIAKLKITLPSKFEEKMNKMILNYSEILNEMKVNNGQPNNKIQRRKVMFHTHSHMHRNNLSNFEFNLNNNVSNNNGQRLSQLVSELNVNSFRITNNNSLLTKELNLETNFISFYSNTNKGFIKFVKEIIEVLNQDEYDNLTNYIKSKVQKEIEGLLNIYNINRDNKNENISRQNLNKNLLNSNLFFANFIKSENYQSYLNLAFYIEDQPHIKDLCMEYYLKALKKERKSFPRVRFLQFLNLFSLKDLQHFLRKTDITILRKILDYKIQKLSKHKNKFNSKNLVIGEEYFFNTDEAEPESKLRKKSTTSIFRNDSNGSEEEFMIKSSFKRKKSSYLMNLKGEEIKSKDKIMKLNIINNFKKVNKIEKDPLSLAEDISIKLLTFINSNSLDKYKQDMLTPKFLLELFNSPQFSEIKNSVAQLQKINLNKIFSNKCKICFWLNIFNFLVIFTIIFKKEVLSNYYEWYRFLKNSYYNIGGYEISLYEIENCILTLGKNSSNIYGEIIKFSEEDIRSNLVLEKSHKLISFGISIPTKCSPSLRIYFPSNLDNLLHVNTVEYFSKNVNIDLDHNLLSVPEYIMWNDPQFKDNLDYYQE